MDTHDPLRVWKSEKWRKGEEEKWRRGFFEYLNLSTVNREV